MKKTGGACLAAGFLLGTGALGFGPGTSFASSHCEAPLTAPHPGK